MVVAAADAAVDMACKDTSIQRLCKDRADSILKPSDSETTTAAEPSFFFFLFLFFVDVVDIQRSGTPPNLFCSCITHIPHRPLSVHLIVDRYAMSFSPLSIHVIISSLSRSSLFAPELENDDNASKTYI